MIINYVNTTIFSIGDDGRKIKYKKDMQERKNDANEGDHVKWKR
jgi:hypothetical protein